VDAAIAAIFAVAVTQLGSGLTQWVMARRAEKAASAQRTADAAEAALRREHELTQQRAQFAAERYDALRLERLHAYQTFTREVGALDHMDATEVRNGQLARAEDALSALTFITNEAVAKSARAYLRKVTHPGRFSAEFAETAEKRDAREEFNRQVQAELQRMQPGFASSQGS
jgi:hypothetical protein